MPNFFLSHKRVKVACRACSADMEGRAARDLRQTRRGPAQGPPESVVNLGCGTRGENAPGVGRWQEQAMKRFTGWIMSAGLVLCAADANAQGLAPYGTARSPYAAVSDFEGSYAPRPEAAEAPRYGYGPSL